jgi:ribosomal protein L14
MLQLESLLTVIDNSGVKTAKIISTYNKPCVKPACIVLVAIQRTIAGRKFNKKYLCLITGTRLFSLRKSGCLIKFDSNSGYCMKDRSIFLGSKFFGPVSLDCRNLKLESLKQISYGFV